MVQQVNRNNDNAIKSGRSWKAVLAILVAAGGFVWHMMACTESPMAFSPDGKNLAFAVMEPYDIDEDLFANKNLFRMMVLGDGKTIQEIEESRDYMLSAPAYSPDGKTWCYLKVPLLTEEKVKELRHTFGQRENELKKMESESQKTTEDLYGKGEGIKGKTKDMSLPSITRNYEISKNLILAPPEVPVALVVRDTADNKVLKKIDLRMSIANSMTFMYLTCQPAYSPDSQNVYVPTGRIIYGVNLGSGDKRILAGPAGAGDEVYATPIRLSPDGKVLATLIGNDEAVLVLVNTDGSRTLYQRLEGSPSLSGMAWVDNQTFVMLDIEKGKDKKYSARLKYYDTDGRYLRKMDLNLGEVKNNDIDTGELALASNGKYMVLAFMEDVFFMTSKGKILKHIKQKEKDILAQPVFTPNSKQVAFKRIVEAEKEKARVTSIVFYSYDGKKKVSEIAIESKTK